MVKPQVQQFCGNRNTVGSFMTNHNFPLSYTQILLTVDLT